MEWSSTHYWESVYICRQWWSHSSMPISRQQKPVYRAPLLTPGRVSSWEKDWPVAAESSLSWTHQISSLIRSRWCTRSKETYPKQNLCGKTSMTLWSHQSLRIDRDKPTFNCSIDKNRISNKARRPWQIIIRNKQLSEASSWIKSQQINFHRSFKPHMN